MATLTITTTAQQDQRISAAYGSLLELKNAQGQPRGANAAEVKEAIINGIRATVHAYERRLAVEAAALAPVAPLDPA